jgi:UDP-GlcNAc3NAcA epimerase
LYREGFSKDHTGRPHVDNPKVIPCGDIMYDNSLYFRDVALKESRILETSGVKPGEFTLVTVHRNNNTEDPARLAAIFESLDRLSHAGGADFIVPLHPRTRHRLENMPELKQRLDKSKGIRIIPPASYLDMIALEANAEMIITDSGGVQKEAYYFEKPCIILQNETPWVELVESGNAELADADPTRIESAFWHFRKHKIELKYPALFGDGKAAVFTVGEIVGFLDGRFKQ